jgi:outer membrane protein OmpA-like peptidoglycan-associated protein
MFEQLVNEAASKLSLSGPSVSALVGGLLSLITNERTGGPAGFVDLFRRAGLGDVVTSWFGGKQGRAITASELESALGAPRIDSLAFSTGLTRATAGSAAAFLLPRLIGRLTPNGAFPSSAVLRTQASSYLERLAVPAVERTEARRGGAGWLPWAAVALLALGAWLWLRAPTGTIDPQLAVVNRDGRVTCSGVVRDQATRTAIVSALGTAFGAGNVDCNLGIDRHVKQIAWLPRLGDLFGALKVPGAEFFLNGDVINLGGWISAADRQAIGDKLRGVFGAQAAIGSLGDAAAVAARASNDKALSALRAIGTSGGSSEAVVQAMNLAVINFPSGTADIPADDIEIVRQSAEAITRGLAGSKIEISGHTDNTGDPASNVALSQARADAVKNALVAAGAPAARLTARGYGDARPRSSNATEYGRFQNRRIEYSVLAVK